ncbi:MAG: metal-dependent hydrolase, partial [Betaproteobacteria bacterium]|nr:metal-dependent hydrolase [Betaproteobacteria bacterium]
GLVVGIAVWLSTLPFVWTWPLYPGYALAMLLIAAVLMSALGLLAGLWADKWDQLSLFQSFLINPLSFLAGVFYSVQSLEEPWKSLAHGNPFFFMIDGLRWAFFGVSDAAAALDFAVSLGFCVTISLLCWLLLARGWRIRH